MQREGASKTVALKPADDWPSRGKIEFKAVQLRYREELPLVLIDLSFTIKAGEKIGKGQIYNILVMHICYIFSYKRLTVNYLRYRWSHRIWQEFFNRSFIPISRDLRGYH